MISRLQISTFLIFLSFWISLNSTAQTWQKSNSVASVTYAVVSVPFSACSFSNGTPILVNQDDKWSTALNIGFNFDYFGISYNSFVASSNGQIGFNTSNAGGYDGWVISNPLPNFVDFPKNVICATFRDIDPTSSGNVYYSSYGTSPNRYLIVSWDSIPLFSSTCLTSLPFSTFQLILHESTNCIDVFIKNSSSCSAWNGGYGIIGIQDSAGTTGYSPPGRNYPNTWTASYEGWRFIPSGSSCSSLTTGPCTISTSLNYFDINDGFNVFPNPVENKFYVKKNVIEDITLELYDIVGRDVLKQKLLKEISEVDVGDLENGIYYLKVINKGNQILFQSKISKH